MLKRLVKLTVSAGLYGWDLMRETALRLVGGTPSPRAVVLYYHGVSQSERAGFERQMEMLGRHATPIQCDPSSLAAGKRYAAVTFDDGFVSVIANALPILRRNRIPATIFVPSGYLGREPGWVNEPSILKRKEIIVTPFELKALAEDPLISIGSHTVTHPRLGQLEQRQVAHELEMSKSAIEQIIGAPVGLFSFPHGSYNRDVLSLAKSAGYKRVFGIKPKMAFEDADEFLTGRVGVDPQDWSIEFVLKLNGAYRWMARLP